MNKSLHKGKGAVYSLRVHLIWCTKYRKPHLTPGVAQDLIDICQNVAAEYKFDIVAIKTDVDHVHMLLDLRPTNFIPDIVQVLKGRSSRFLRQLHPKLRKDAKLWSPSYFVRTISDADNDTVIKYIESQGKA